MKIVCLTFSSVTTAQHQCAMSALQDVSQILAVKILKVVAIHNFYRKLNIFFFDQENNWPNYPLSIFIFFGIPSPAVSRQPWTVNYWLRSYAHLQTIRLDKRSHRLILAQNLPILPYNFTQMEG
jgi:hypothetical protein